MRTTIVAIAAAVALLAAAAPAAGIVHTLQVEAHGQCQDGDGNGGGGRVYVFPYQGTVDAVDADEAQSIAQGVALFAQGSADQAAQGNPGGDACASDDTDSNGDETHGSEDHVSAQFVWLDENVVVGVCYDADGLHTTADCHGSASDDGSDDGYHVGTPSLP